MPNLKINDEEPGRDIGEGEKGSSSSQYWRVLWPDGRIENFASEEAAREFRSRFPRELPVVVQAQTMDLTWDASTWTDQVSVAHLFTRPGSKVHILSPESRRFLCGIQRTGGWRRVEAASVDQLCNRCVKREFVLHQE